MGDSLRDGRRPKSGSCQWVPILLNRTDLQQYRCVGNDETVRARRFTAVFSGRVRRTPTDARALLTRKIQEIQKIHSATMSTCSDMRSCYTVICCVY